jgi:ankyrin repeat protein/HEAT repeat protein
VRCFLLFGVVLFSLTALSPLGADARAPTAVKAAEEPRIAVTVHGSDAAEAFAYLQGKGIFVIPLGTLSTHSFIVPADLRFRPVPANELLAGVARLHGLSLTWWKSGITIAVLQRGAPAEEVDAVIADLGSASAETRTGAAWRAGWIEDAAVLPALVARTADSDRWVSRQAKHAIVRLGWPAAIFFAPKESLALLDPAKEAGTTFSALTWRMIAETYGTDALPLLKTAGGREILNAIAALGRVPGDESVAILEKIVARMDVPELRRQAVVGLGLNGGKKAIAALNRSLTNGSLYGDALAALAGVSKENALPAVKAGLKQRRPDAYAALGEIGGTEALALCAAALKDKSPEIRRAAVDAIGGIGGSGAPALLAQALADADAEVRLRAARALGRIGGTAAVAVLTNAEGQATREVWEQIVLSLGETGGTDARDFLMSAADTPRFSSGVCAVALGREAGDLAVAKLRDLLANPNAASSAAEALGRIGSSQAIAALTAGFSSTDPAVRLGIVMAAGQAGGQRAIPLLAQAARGTDSELVRSAIIGLPQCGGPGSIDLLASLRGNWEPGVRRAVAQGLGAIGGAEAVNALTGLLTDTERLVRQDAIAAVVAADMPQSVALVGGSFGDEARRYQATNSLGKLGGPEALAVLDKLLETDPRLAVFVANNFDYREATPFWVKVLKRGDSTIREVVDNFVRGYPVAAAIAASDDPEARALAIPYLFPYADMEFAQAQVTGLLFDTDERVRKQAVATLGQTKEPGRTQILSLAVARDRDSTISAVRRLGSEELSIALAQVCKVGDPSGLIKAVEKHDTAGVKSLLAKGANLNARYPVQKDQNKSKTILMEAASRGYADIVTLLVQSGASLEATDSPGMMTALSYAILSDKGEESATTLLRLGARTQAGVWDGTGRGSTMFSACVRLGRLEPARILIEQGADVNAADWEGFTPLMTAARNGRTDIAGLLLDKGARIDERSKTRETALMMALSGGNTGVAQLLLDRGADTAAVDAQGKGVLARAVEAGNIDIVKQLAARGGPNGTTVLEEALMAAALAGKVDTIETLLAGGVTPAWEETDRADSMVRAAAAGRLDVIIALQKKGMRLESTDATATTPLAAAAEKGRIETVRYLVKKGAHVNAGDSRGWTPLMRAAAAGQVEMVTLLLQAGADGFAVNNAGGTAFDCAQGQKVTEALTAWKGPLIEAIRRGDLEAVRKLATAATVNVREPSWQTPGWPGPDTPNGAQDNYGARRTPLMFAAEADRTEIARVLLQRGARITDTYEAHPGTSGQYTARALDEAVFAGSAGVLGLLLDNGEKATDDLLLWACRNGHLDAVKVLVAHGASVKASVPESPWSGDDEGASWSGDAISAALQNGNMELVDFLRQKGAPLTPYALTAALSTSNPDLAARFLAAGSGVSVNALITACWQGYTDLVREILKRGADPDGIGSSGSTPLEAAVQSGKIEIVRLLLERGATVGKKDARGQTVLDSLEERGGDQTYAIKRLLEETGKDTGAYALQSDLTRAILKKDAAAVKKLLAQKPDPATLTMSEADPLAKQLNNPAALVDVACVLESKEIVKLLVQNGAAVGSWSRGLRYAAGLGRADLVEILLSAAEPQKDDAQGRLDTALVKASENGNADLVATLLSKGANPDSQIDRTALMSAVESGSLIMVKALLARGAKVNTLSSWRYAGTSALSLAMAGGWKDIVKLLLASGADGGGSTGDGMTPLITFLRARDSDAVATLLKNGAVVNVKDSNGETPLHIAVSQGNLELVKAIVAKRADLEARDRTGRNPLMRSVSLADHQEISLVLLRQGTKVTPSKPGEPSVVDAFMAYGSWNDAIVSALEAAYAANPITDPSRDRIERFYLALMKRDLTAAAALIGQGAPVDQPAFDDRTPLMGAAGHGDLDVMKLLIDKGADPARDGAGGSALDAAVNAGSEEAAALLLPLLPRTPDPKERMLRGAAATGNLKLVQKLLDQGVNPDATGRTGLAPLFFASMGGHLDVVRLLLTRNVMVNRTGSSGYTGTTATAACQAGFGDVVGLLVSRGAKVSWLDALTLAPRELRTEITKIYLANAGAEEKKGDTARGFLVMAELDRNIETVKLLLAAGIKPDGGDWGGHTALGAAVGPDWYNGSPEIARLLIEAGAPVDSHAFLGPALWVAASKGYTDVVKAMLARGANPNLTGEDGTTALRAAAYGDHPLIVKMLIAKGAKSELSPPELEYLYEVLK